MLLRHYIPKDKKYISIVGETKTTLSKDHKNKTQRKDYLTFIKLVNNLINSSNSDEFLIIMYIYDISFSLFKNESIDYDIDEEPIIYGYMQNFIMNIATKAIMILLIFYNHQRKKLI